MKKRAALQIQKHFRGYIARQGQWNHVQSKLNRDLDGFDDMRVRVFSDLTRKCGILWLTKTMDRINERRRQVRAPFMFIAMRVYKKYKKEKEKQEKFNRLMGKGRKGAKITKKPSNSKQSNSSKPKVKSSEKDLSSIQSVTPSDGVRPKLRSIAYKSLNKS